MLRQSLIFLVVVGMLAGCGKLSRKSSEEATLFDMNQALAVATMRVGHCPSDVNELTNSPILEGKRLPTPPAGKKLAIDKNKHSVVFVDVVPEK